MLRSGVTFHDLQSTVRHKLPKTCNNFLCTNKVPDVPACDGDAKQAPERRPSLVRQQLREHNVGCPRADVVETLAEVLYRRVHALLADLSLQIINRLNDKIGN